MVTEERRELPVSEQVQITEHAATEQPEHAEVCSGRTTCVHRHCRPTVIAIGISSLLPYLLQMLGQGRSVLRAAAGPVDLDRDAS